MDSAFTIPPKCDKIPNNNIHPLLSSRLNAHRPFFRSRFGNIWISATCRDCLDIPSPGFSGGQRRPGRGAHLARVRRAEQARVHQQRVQLVHACLFGASYARQVRAAARAALAP